MEIKYRVAVAIINSQIMTCGNIIYSSARFQKSNQEGLSDMIGTLAIGYIMDIMSRTNTNSNVINKTMSVVLKN